MVALVLYLLHAQNNNRALFSLKLFRTRTFSLGTAGLCRTYWQWHVALYDTGFSCKWSRFLAVSCRTDDDPDGARQHGNEAVVVQVVNRFGYRRVLVATTLGLSLVTLLFMTTALLGWYYVLPFVLFYKEWSLDAFSPP